MRNNSTTTTAIALVIGLTLSACPRPKDDDGTSDDGAREETGTSGKEPPKPQT